MFDMGQSDASWGPGWPHGAQGQVVDLAFKGQMGTVHFPAGIRKELEPLAQILLAETERRHYKIHPGWCWGYANRPIAGTNIPSNHSRGTALDINAPENGYGDTTPAFPTIIIREVWNECGWEWGGDWSNHDGMHVEYLGSVQSVDAMLEKAQRLFGEEPQMTDDEKAMLLEVYRFQQGEILALKGEPEPAEAGPVRRGYRAAERYLKDE